MWKIKLTSISKIKGKIENFKRIYELLKKDSLTEFENIGISFNSTIKLEISIDSLESLDEECKKYISNLETDLDKEYPESLSNKKKNLETELEAIQSRLNESEKIYQNYLDELAQWEKRRDEIIGRGDKLNSLEYLKKELEKSIEIEHLILVKAKEERCQKVKDVYSQLKQLAEVYEDLYRPVQKFIDEHELIKDKYELNFNVSIAETDLLKNFLIILIKRQEELFMVLKKEEKN